MPPMAPMMPLGVMAAPVRVFSLLNSAVEDSMVNMIDTYTILPPGMTMGHIPDTRGLMQNHRMPVSKKPPHMPPGLGRKNQTQRWTPMSFNANKNDERRGDGGPTITVFVGNITDRASDNMIKHILQRCGCVVSWKRVQGASGKLQGTFGFCEYADPESGLRAIRLLHEWEIGDRKLVVKVDAKTKAQLDEYKAAKKAKKVKEGGAEPEVENAEDVDEDTQREDRVARAGIDAIIREHEHELSRPSLSDSPKKSKLSKAQEALLKISGQTGNGEGGGGGGGSGEGKEGKDNLDEMDIEEDKKNLIHREIGKFRDTMKKLEEEKERERERRERDRERREKERDRDRDRNDRREKENNRLRSKTPDRPREKVIREHSRERSYERSRSRSRERERSKERERSRERSREVEYDKTKRDKDIEREREEEEEAYERKKLERKLREKEAAYQERLRNWEARERKKSREYDKEKEKEEEKRSEEVKEAKRLKEFLEDYDDDRDDPKYYKGSALNRRLKEREKEIEIDSRDRQREKEELEELKQKLLEEGHPDPNGEFERIKREREEQFRPKIKIEPPAEEEKENINVNLKMKPVISSPAPEPELPTIKAKLRAIEVDDTTQNSLSGFSDITTPKEEVKQKPLGFTGLKLGSSPNQQQQSSGKRKKVMSLGEVFNQDEDDSSDSQPRKRKLVPLDYTDEEKKAVTQPSSAAAAAAAAAAATSTSQEEKRKHIKNLIDKIPTEKDKLFAYNIDWSIVDNVLMEKRIKPWINKKIVEYIGEEEPTLVDFICSKVMAGSTPQCVLDDVQMVLDEEAEVFVVKMWRLLIYEIEAKKLGIMK